METVSSVRDMENAVLSNTWACIVFTRGNSAVGHAAVRRISLMLRKFTDVPGFTLDLDNDPTGAGRYLIFETPSVLVYYNGKPIIREIGSVTPARVFAAMQDFHQAIDRG